MMSEPGLFSDVRFVLVGFDPLTKTQVLSKLVNGGGVDVGHYGPDCTHVIVHNLLYDDPACVAARNDGKALVNGLWVAHSFELGMPVGTNSIMYKPPRDQIGIPGAQFLVMCLTGYQCQDRDDIMTMVSLMGAKFSKPLIASKVTHLICYKFEGEKYELAKKIKKIKIVNHMWLEDCLKAWKILPEIDYDKSGYEMEVLEAVAKDSEEADVTSKNYQILNPEESIRNQLDSSVSRDRPNPINANNMAYATGRERLSDQDLNKIEAPATVGDALVSASGSGSRRSPHSDASKSILRPYSGKTTQTMYTGEGTGSLNTGTIINTGKLNVNDEVGFPIVSKHVEDNIDKYSTVGNKRRLEVSHASTKSQKSGQKSKSCISVGSQEINRRELLESTSLISGQNNTSDQVLSDRDTHDLSPSAASSPLKRTTRLSSRMSLSAERESAKFATPISKTTNLETSLDAKLGKAAQIDFVNSEKGSLHFIPENRGKDRQEYSCGEAPKNSSSKSLPETERCNGPSDEGMHSDAHCKPPVNKIYNRKTWSKGSTTKLKGCNYLNTSVPEEDPALSYIGVEETANNKKLGFSPPAANCTELRVVEIDVSGSRNEVQRKFMSVDDETEAEALVEKINKVAKAVGDENETYSTGESDKSEDLITNKTDGAKFGMHGSKTSGNENVGSKLEKVACGKRKLGESANMQIPVKKSVSRRKKCSLNEQKNTVVPDKDPEKEATKALFEKNCGVAEAEISGKQLGICSNKTYDEDKDATKLKKARTCSKRKLAQSANLEKTVKENMRSKGKRCCQNKINKTAPIGARENDKKYEFKEACEENAGKVEPDICGNLGAEEKSEVHLGAQDKSEVRGCETDCYAFVVPSPTTSAGEKMHVRTDSISEPVWFITSGDKPQRKEFQQEIRRLKGKLCKDSHKWSYQATHFIVPDPLRRTEKFFAAAASGRWILKKDYISDSSKAGKFLAEEPYEWYKSGLSEDGAINLEAPRKWRLQRERTGHGAFYGMRIVIYGECIAPSLDTLKRVVKAGDGTILATSPPYTRFLESGIDFAVVSPSMPHTDMWAQEFLRHKIPCVVADYLVEFVCKPGYSLKEHVQFDTNDWAEKSLNKLVNQSETNFQPPAPKDYGSHPNLPCPEATKPPNCCGDNVLTCQVCGSRGTREEMLICGKENNSTGCGIGMHIDCCDSPLPNVPEQDWLCPKCTKTISRKRTSKSARKRTLV